MGRSNTKKQDSPFQPLIDLSDKLKGTEHTTLSLSDVIGIAELLTNSLQPLLRRIDATLQNELRGILNRIETLRDEIARARVDDISTTRIPEMGRELSAVVESTEEATNTIMEAAEAVLNADSSAEGYADLVSDKMMAIFEACSFQDLTGQRVNKVVETVEIIEDRINLLCSMLDQDGLGDGGEEELTEKEKRKRDLLLNGPQMKGEGVNQAEIDEMF